MKMQEYWFIYDLMVRKNAEGLFPILLKEPGDTFTDGGAGIGTESWYRNGTAVRGGLYSPWDEWSRCISWIRPVRGSIAGERDLVALQVCLDTDRYMFHADGQNRIWLQYLWDAEWEKR